MSSRETIGNFIVFQALQRWVYKHLKSDADKIEADSALEEIWTGEKDLTLSDAKYRIEHALEGTRAETGRDPFKTLYGEIDTQSIQYERSIEGEVLEAAEKIKSAIEAGLITPKAVGLYRKPVGEVTPEEKKRLKARIDVLESELEKSTAPIPQPKFKVGQIVEYPSLGEAEVTEMELKPNKAWSYTIKRMGTEYLARESELTFVGERPPPPVVAPPVKPPQPPPKKTTEEDLETLWKIFETSIRNRVGREPSDQEHELWVRVCEGSPTVEEARQNCSWLVQSISPERKEPPANHVRLRIGFQTPENEKWLGKFFSEVERIEQFKAEERERKALEPPKPPPDYLLRVTNNRTGSTQNLKYWEGQEEDMERFIRNIAKEKYKGQPLWSWERIK